MLKAVTKNIIEMGYMKDGQVGLTLDGTLVHCGGDTIYQVGLNKGESWPAIPGNAQLVRLLGKGEKITFEVI